MYIFSKNKVKNVMLAIFIVSLFFAVEKNIAHAASASYAYPMLGSFPGFFDAKQAMDTNSTNDFPALILAIYKFAIWTVGIAGLFMLVIGGFMYMASAGNTSTASNARGIISDALVGIVVVFAAYLMAYVINPDLTVMKISWSTVEVKEMDDFGGGNDLADPVTSATTSTGGCMKVVRAAEASKAAGWVYSQKLRGQTVSGIRYTDCSNLTYSAYKTAGCSSPGGDTGSMYAKAVSFSGTSDLKAGDAIVRVGHVVICMTDGCGAVIHAPGTGKPITIKSGTWTTSKSGDWANAKVIKASSYCGSC